MSDTPKPKRPLRRIVSIVLRVLIAAAGLSIVAFQLTWRDSVEIPGSYEIAPGVLTTDSVELPIVERTEAQVTVRYEEKTIVIATEQLTADESGPRFKPGLISTFGSADVKWILLAFLVNFAIYPLQTARWGVLMKARGLPVRPWQTFRIFMAGLFYSSFMPGMTGGDVFKAYYVARHSDRKADAIVSILADRFTGLVGLVILASLAAGVALSMGMDDPTTRTAGQTVAVAAVIFIVAAAIYFTPFLQRLFGMHFVSRLLPRRGPVAAAKQAVAAYSDHKGAVVLSVGLGVIVHVTIILAALISARAVGMETGTIKFVALMPLVVMAGSLPLSFMGLGLIEPTGVALLGETGVASVNQIVTMLVLIRVYQVAWSAVGAAFVIHGGLTLPGKETQRHPDTQAQRCAERTHSDL